MKNIVVGLRVLLSLFAAFCWWGFLYPEITMTPDTYRISMGDGSLVEDGGPMGNGDFIGNRSFTEDGAIQKVTEVIEWNFKSDIYRRVLNADRSKLKFKSKLLQTVAELLEKR
jgi:hypothetical protein